MRRQQLLRPREDEPGRSESTWKARPCLAAVSEPRMEQACQQPLCKGAGCVAGLFKGPDWCTAAAGYCCAAVWQSASCSRLHFLTKVLKTDQQQPRLEQWPLLGLASPGHQPASISLYGTLNTVKLHAIKASTHCQMGKSLRGLISISMVADIVAFRAKAACCGAYLVPSDSDAATMTCRQGPAGAAGRDRQAGQVPGYSGGCAGRSHSSSSGSCTSQKHCAIWASTTAPCTLAFTVSMSQVPRLADLELRSPPYGCRQFVVSCILLSIQHTSSQGVLFR